MGTIVYLSLGSNLGDKFDNLQKAIRRIGETCGSIIQESPIYKTPPLGFESDDNFLNMCLSLETKLTPSILLNRLKEIEIEIGRKKKSINGTYVSRIIDIDIILFGDHIIDANELQIPHPKYTERLFVIKPLEDISKDIFDPKNGKSIRQLKEDCIDQSQITPYEQ